MQYSISHHVHADMIHLFEVATATVRKSGGASSRCLEEVRQVDQTARGGNILSRKITYAAMLEMTFASNSRPLSTVALMHRVHRSSVRDIFYLAAIWYLATQRTAVEMMLLRSRAKPAEFALVRLCWDETGERFCMNSSADAGWSQGKPQTWNVLVARMHHMWFARQAE